MQFDDVAIEKYGILNVAVRISLEILGLALDAGNAVAEIAGAKHFVH